MSSFETYNHKRGATLSLAGTVLLPAGTWTASARVVQASDLVEVEDLEVTLEPLDPVTATTTHSILIEGTAAQAADWPIAKLKCDVRFEDASDPVVVIHSPTFIINVGQEITDGD